MVTNNMNEREKEMAEAIERAERADHTEDATRSFARPRTPSAPSQVYSLRIPVAHLDALRRAARRRAVQPSTLMREWVIERLEVELASDDSAQGFPYTITTSTREVAELSKQLPRGSKDRGRRMSEVTPRVVV